MAEKRTLIHLFTDRREGDFSSWGDVERYTAYVRRALDDFYRMDALAQPIDSFADPNSGATLDASYFTQQYDDLSKENERKVSHLTIVLLDKIFNLHASVADYIEGLDPLFPAYSLRKADYLKFEEQLWAETGLWTSRMYFSNKRNSSLPRPTRSSVSHLLLVFQEAIEVYRSVAEVQDWLQTRLESLNNETPAGYLTTVYGRHRLIELLGQYKYGYTF